jgi:hypothetical protein
MASHQIQGNNVTAPAGTFEAKPFWLLRGADQNKLASRKFDNRVN